MKFITANDYRELSKIASDIMIQTCINKKDSNICLATGASPKLAYKIFVESCFKQKLDVTKLKFTKLDEWGDMNKHAKESCEAFLQLHVYKPLRIKKKQIISFYADAENYELEVTKVKQQLEVSPIDLCILGLGKNGHLGLNEPNDYLLPHAHRIQLSDSTRRHPMLCDLDISYGMTIGMREIMSAKKIILLVSGKDKKKIYRSFLTGLIHTKLPTSFLWLHSDVTIIVQEDDFL